jgi:hypothetical protein
MLEEERRDVGEEKAKGDIPEGMSQLALLASSTEVAAKGFAESISAAVDEVLPDALAEESVEEGPFPDEPFEAVRRPQLVGTGQRKGRRLVKPEEPHHGRDNPTHRPSPPHVKNPKTQGRKPSLGADSTSGCSAVKHRNEFLLIQFRQM